MSDLTNRAIKFAMEAHQRIDHRRKYSDQPYSIHLEQVAKIVSSVTDDEEMISVNSRTNCATGVLNSRSMSPSVAGVSSTSVSPVMVTVQQERP